MTREQILDEAKSIVCKDRNKQYGEPENNFGIIAELWNKYLSKKPGCLIQAEDVATMMMLFKVGRLISGGYKHDTLVDLIGYAACAEELENHQHKFGVVNLKEKEEGSEVYYEVENDDRKQEEEK
jgi:hypothetical protein